MLKYIRYQTCADQNLQRKNEESESVKISRRYKHNMAAFSRTIPSVLPLIASHDPENLSIFVTNAKQINIVNYGTGKTWYSETPEQDMQAEVSAFLASSPYFDLRHGSESEHWLTQPISEQVETVIMFGLGLGYQLQYLIEQIDIKYLIIYEPSLDVVHCSLQAADWHHILQMAEEKGTQLFLQLGNDGSSLPEDFAELLPLLNDDKVFVYRHYFHPIMDEVIRFAFCHSNQYKQLTNKNHVFSPDYSLYNYIAEHNQSVLGNYTPERLNNSDLFEQNLLTLKEYYPQVFSVISDYSPVSWYLVKDGKNQANLLHKKRNALFYDNLESESNSLVSDFESNPLKDDVVLGQQVSNKLGHYIHFQAVQKVQTELQNIITSDTVLPEHVESIIIFGIGLGVHIESLCDGHEISNLYICEPNLDFFLASLHVVDWSKIIRRADQAGQRIYFNLGGDGADYFSDLMAQFYQVGAYSIANTYLLSSYFDAEMHQSISTLRSELSIVLALGEYFDHARYGIAHTYFNLKYRCRFLKLGSEDYDNEPLLSKPLFIVGNGPSLDDSIDYLQHYRDQVILISCGTALKSLHSKKITPDFHAEIEQNKATFHWISQVNDAEYLKSIRLLSINGIHPDTASLFKEVLLCFKSGEPATVLFQPEITKAGYKTKSLSYAYPTVSNLAVNFALMAGFKYIYLFGIDLGYTDINYHHSKLSAYYKTDGSQIYDYKSAHGDGIAAEGNFLPLVYTKREFDVSRKLIEKALMQYSCKVEVYNCSNGVKITGAIPLHPECILLNEPNVSPADIEHFIKNAFFDDLSKFSDEIFSSMDTLELSEAVFRWLEYFDTPVCSIEDARRFIDEQWIFFRSKISNRNSLIFFLFSGTSNYFSSVLTKILASSHESESTCLHSFNIARKIWRDCIQQAHDSFIEQPLELDNVDVSHLFK
ncbi:DUF115 domain-containing protein [Alkalimonas collagenimarina]|uniref:DUF115 domain-containing protein n=1 Tax=Alkalimonas collagenimarina TaxID=400390 RepID=A0ABT9GXW3_9GAMM|nr:6-hydroxymethylpterin diphosphokinase MptE-like protein [Alkalimonas collagenimarina]MDP4535893.1 DUF115 domain-containing protein [Alkalimonas collagenimarina]